MHKNLKLKFKFSLNVNYFHKLLEYLNLLNLIFKRFSSIVKTKGIRQSFEKKKKLREDLKHIKELSREKVAKMKEDKELKKQRRMENLKRAEENRKKSEIVQVVSLFNKILNTVLEI